MNKEQYLEALRRLNDAGDLGALCSQILEMHAKYGDDRQFINPDPKFEEQDANPIQLSIKHGTTRAYKYFQCRCLECTAANTEAQRRYQENRRARRERE